MTPQRKRLSTAHRVVLAVTVPQSLVLMSGFPEELGMRGWDVHVVSSGEPLTPYPPGVTFHALPMQREPSPLMDLVALVRWIRLLVRLRPDLVSAGTPKAALLGCVAAALVRVPSRVYVLRGLRLETEVGLRRRVLWMFEWITSQASTAILSVSPSLSRVYLRENLSRVPKLTVLGAGSSNGVNLNSPTADAGVASAAIDRNSLGLWVDAPVVGYVGRVARDKGIGDLLRSIVELRERGVRVQLLIIGGEESTGLLQRLLAESKMTLKDVHWIGTVADARPYYSLMDVLCLPTRREGFPNVVLEAAAASVPAIVSDVTGARDSVVHGKTGLLFPQGEIKELAEQIMKVISNPSLKAALGEHARARAEAEFDRNRVWDLTEEYYRRQIARSNRKRGHA